MLTESQIQRQIVDYLQYTGWLVLQTYLGSNRGGSVWMTKGLPDICAIKNGRHVWLEIKTPAGRVKPEQEILHQQLRAHGAEIYVVRSLEDCIKALEDK